jgi:hypothetical protein
MKPARTHFARVMRICAATALAVSALLLVAEPFARACPFCQASMQTLSQEITSADVALIAELVEAMPTSSPEGDVGQALPAAKFRVLDVLHGEDKLDGAKEISVVYFGEEAPDKKFMITGLAGVTGPGLDWTTPVPLSEPAVDYVKKLPTVPATGADRLAFFQEYLENDDRLLAQDAYDEFARMPYADVVALGPRMDREKILQWIDDASVGPSSRRLYLTMLGVCGKPEDVGMLERLMNYDYLVMKPAIAAVVATGAIASPAASAAGLGLVDEIIHAEERRKRESLDAMIACYLKLKGPAGLALVNELFLANPNVEFKHLHSTIMALRFHGEETDVLPREKLLESMRLALDHRDFADQVIPDLTRWEDWEVMPRLVKMFKDSPQDDWIRQPVATYLIVAAEAEGDAGVKGAEALTEVDALDHETVDRARKLSAFGFLQRASASPAATPADGTDAPTGDTAPPPAADPPVAGVPKADDALPAEVASAKPSESAPVAKASPPVAATTIAPPSRIKIIGIPLLAAGVLLAIFAVLLRGADPRSSDDNNP